MSASTERKNRAAAKAAGTDKKTLAAQEAEQKARKAKRKWVIGTVAVLLCIALVLFLSSPIMYRVTTAVSVGDKNYSPADVKYVRASAKASLGNAIGFGGVSYDQIVSYFGQETADQLLAEVTSGNLVRNTALLKTASEQGLSLSSTEKNAIADSVKTQIGSMKDAAKLNGVSFSTYMSYLFGAGVNENVMRRNMEEGVLAEKAYLDKSISLSFTPEELAAYYTDPADGDVFSYMSYLVAVNDERTAEEAKAAAEAMMMSFTDGRDEAVAPELAFSDLLAEEIPDATPTQRTEVLGSNLDESFRSWLTDESRQAGDITVIDAGEDSGWYVLLFLDRDDNTEEVAAVRHILVKAEADENGVYTDEAKAAAKAKAEKILADFEKTGKTEADFAILAYLLSEDSGSSGNGGLYSTLTPGQTVPEFDAFCFADHQYGDTAIVYGESDAYAGYHVMFFVERLPGRDAVARDALRSQAMNDWSSALIEGLEPVTHWANKLAD